RSIDRLAAVDYEKIVNASGMRGWLTRRVGAELAALRAAFPSPPHLPKGAELILARVQPPPAAPRRTPEEELDRNGDEDPDDPAPRAVLADFLAERGDPRGELITLQLAGAPATEKRELQLIRKHQFAWLGAFGPLLFLWDPRVGPPLVEEGK